MAYPLYKSLLNTAYKSNSIFVDEIDSAQKLQLWLDSNGFTDSEASDELVFNLQNIRHMMKKIVNQISINKSVDFDPINKFSEKFKTTNSLIQIGRDSVDFLNDGIMFEEPYHSILISFKIDVKRKQNTSPA